MIGGLSIFWFGIDGFGASKDDVLTIRTPNTISLDKLGIVGTRKGFTTSCRTVINRQNSSRGIKDLKESIVLKVLHEVGTGNGLTQASKCRQYVFAVRRDLRHESHASLPNAKVRVPRNHVLIANGSLRLYCHGSIESFVVSGTVHIDPHPFAVGRERVAVCAGVEIMHHNFALRLGDVAKAPID